MHFDRRGDADLPGGFQNEGAHSKDGLMFSLGIDCFGSLITESMFIDSGAMQRDASRIECIFGIN